MLPFILDKPLLIKQIEGLTNKKVTSIKPVFYKIGQVPELNSNQLYALTVAGVSHGPATTYEFFDYIFHSQIFDTDFTFRWVRGTELPTNGFLYLCEGVTVDDDNLWNTFTLTGFKIDFE